MNVSIQVHGKVQGVWFRYFTRKEALQLELNGFVENRPDGSVYLEVSGSESSVKELVTWCNTGSPQSRVEKVEVTEITKKHIKLFEIRE
jgi:acylphosphatase